MTPSELQLPVDAQLRALATLKVHELLATRGQPLDYHRVNARRFLSVTRQEMIDYFRAHPHLAEAHLTEPTARPYHDHLCIERRGQHFAVFDMDHGQPRGEHLYDSLAEAAADFAAWSYAYGYKPSA